MRGVLSIQFKGIYVTYYNNVDKYQAVHVKEYETFN